MNEILETPRVEVKLQVVGVPVTENVKNVYVDDVFFKDMANEKKIILTKPFLVPSMWLLIYHDLFRSAPLHKRCIPACTIFSLGYLLAYNLPHVGGIASPSPMLAKPR